MKMNMIIVLVMYVCTVFVGQIISKPITIGRAVNLGNALEAPNEGDWGVILEEEFFKLIKEKKFTAIRIPIRWSAHLENGKIESKFMERVDWAVRNTLEQGLIPIVNIHHYDKLNEEPETEKEQFLKIWEELSSHYKNYSDSLVFEILNEPHGKIDPLWNDLQKEALAVIRKANKERTVIITPAQWGGLNNLEALSIPSNDKNLILSIHYYSPFQFTHQGAEWVDGSDAWLGTQWKGNRFDKLSIQKDMERIDEFSKKNNIPVFIGEFGAYSKADMKSRARWTEYCGRIFERYNFSWSYWEFCSGFGIYDAKSKSWKKELVDALISNDTTCLKIDTLTTGKNMLQNGNFDDEKKHWIFGAWEGEATAQFNEKRCDISISKIGKDPWNIQLLQEKISIEKGEVYVLSFDARSPDEISMSGAIARSDNYKNYTETGTLRLTKQFKRYQCHFTAPEDYDNVRAVFSVSFNEGNISIDNVSFAKVVTSIAEENKHTPLYKIKTMTLLSQKYSLPVPVTGKVSYTIQRINGQKVRENLSSIKDLQNTILNKGRGVYLLSVLQNKQTFSTIKITYP